MKHPSTKRLMVKFTSTSLYGEVEPLRSEALKRTFVQIFGDGTGTFKINKFSDEEGTYYDSTYRGYGDGMSESELDIALLKLIRVFLHKYQINVIIRCSLWLFSHFNNADLSPHRRLQLIIFIHTFTSLIEKRLNLNLTKNSIFYNQRC